MPETPSDYRNTPSAYGQITTPELTTEGEVKQLPLGPLYGEIGGTGLKRSSGIIDEEFLPALRGRKAVQVFTEMSLNDATVGSLLFTIEKLLRQVDWTVVGADSSPEQNDAVEFIEQCMDDMSHSFDDLISEILSMLAYGWSWFEIVYKKRVGPWEKSATRKSKYTDGRIGWRKMPIRSQETLFRWIFDDTGGIKGLVQIPAPDYVQRTISIEKSLLFRTGAHKGNPEGLSILRRAYRSWYFKKRLEEFEAIGVERDLAGMPVVKVPSVLMSPKATPDQQKLFAAFKKMVTNIRRDEHEGLILPSDADPDTKLPLYELELMSAGGSRTIDIRGALDRHETNILMTVLADFIKLGHQGTGSYSMHIDKTGIFRAAINSIAQSIADVFNRHAIPRLFAVNDWKLDQLPHIEPGNVDPPNLAELGGFMQQMSGLGMTFFPDPDLEKFLRDTAHLPELTEEQQEMHRQMAEQQNAMEFMDSEMQTQGMQEKQELVDQGMSPEQAEMATAGPTPEQVGQEQVAEAKGHAIARKDPDVVNEEKEQIDAERQLAVDEDAGKEADHERAVEEKVVDHKLSREEKDEEGKAQVKGDELAGRRERKLAETKGRLDMQKERLRLKSAAPMDKKKKPPRGNVKKDASPLKSDTPFRRT